MARLGKSSRTSRFTTLATLCPKLLAAFQAKKKPQPSLGRFNPLFCLDLPGFKKVDLVPVGVGRLGEAIKSSVWPRAYGGITADRGGGGESEEG